MRPGVQRYLEYAHSQGIALALVSNSRRPYIDRWLKRLRLTDWFDGVVTRDGTLAIKPAPDLYLKAVREMGTTPDNVIAIEDSVMGLKAALAAGLCAVAFPNQASEKLVKEFFPLCVALEHVAPQEFIRRVAAYYR